MDCCAALLLCCGICNDGQDMDSPAVCPAVCNCNFSCGSCVVFHPASRHCGDKETR